MIAATDTVYERAYAVLSEPDPAKKIEPSFLPFPPNLIADIGGSILVPPDRPARPEKPNIHPPRNMPRRSTGRKGRIAFVHALAHIELNAIDLAWDIIIRFGPNVKEPDFFTDWLQIAKEEAEHFKMLSDRLNELGHNYGDLPAHDGLWEAAIKTSNNALDRLAVIPMMLEARSIDTTPSAVARLKKAGDHKTATILEKIYVDEIGHLRTGVFWFERICKQQEREPVRTWKTLIVQHLNTRPKGPFNYEGRLLASMSPAYWEQWGDT